MKTPTLAPLLQDIQALIQAETGKPLQGAAAGRLETLLENAVANTVGLENGKRVAPREVTVLLTDLRGFTAISEAHTAAVLLEMLNSYLVRMS